MQGDWKQWVKWKKTCSTCDGDGKIVCHCDAKGELSCPNCGGTGVEVRQKTLVQRQEMPCDNPQCQHGVVPCSNCNGTGKNVWGKQCEVCHGSGREECPVCHGIGRIERKVKEFWIEHTTCSICSGRRMVACYLCHGTKVRVCPTCNGSGEQLDKGKILMMCALAGVFFAMPWMFAAIGVLLLGWNSFRLWKSVSAEADGFIFSEKMRKTSRFSETSAFKGKNG